VVEGAVIQVDRFFKLYAAAFNSGDAAAVARHIAAPALLIERTAITLWSSEADVLAAMQRLLAFYRANGFASARCTIDRLLEQGHDNAVAHVFWTIERKDAPAWRFHTGYNLRRFGEDWRIVVCTAYEEAAARG
jgi:ketosteroid isomerase-like protein